MTWEDAQNWEGNGWSEGAYEGAEWNASGNLDEWREGGVYCMLNAASVNDQLNQDKQLYMENFQKGGDKRIEGFEDVLFVFANSKDVKRDDYKVSLLNEWKDEAPTMAVHKGPPTTPCHTSSS